VDPEPDRRSQTIAQLKEQAEWCRSMGSPLYAHLLDHAAADTEAGGVTWQVLEPHTVPGRRGSALALRLMAAVHRLVLTGAAPELAAYYPSVGGDPARGDAWPAFHALLESETERLRADAGRPCQTNEVGRCAALVVGFFEVAHRTRLPLRALEVGASAGLNLRWDHFRYGDGHTRWGDPGSPVDLDGLWDEPPAHLDAPLTVAARRGCDLHPLDPARDEDRLALQASVWADQVARFRRLRGALELAARVPATVDAAPLDEWVPARLAEDADGAATVVYHSIVEEYVPAPQLQRFHGAMRDAGARATDRAPLGWVRLEPLPGVRRHGLTVTVWPGGEDRVVAECGAHGTNVRRAFVA
jgi:hypothetical protein